jgi:hypothetical protein
MLETSSRQVWPRAGGHVSGTAERDVSYKGPKNWGSNRFAVTSGGALVPNFDFTYLAWHLACDVSASRLPTESADIHILRATMKAALRVHSRRSTTISSRLLIASLQAKHAVYFLCSAASWPSSQPPSSSARRCIPTSRTATSTWACSSSVSSTCSSTASRSSPSR